MRWPSDSATEHLGRCIPCLLLYIMVFLRSDFAVQTVILSGSVVLPLKWSKVGQVIRTTLGNGSNVINLPSILTGSVSIVFPTNPGSTLVFTPHRRVIVTDCLCLLPYSKLCFFTEDCHCEIGYSSCCLNSAAELYSFWGGGDAQERVYHSD